MKSNLLISYDDICIVCRLIVRFCSSSYGCTISFYFIWQALFIFAILQGWLPADLFDEGMQQALTASLTIAVHTVVAFNTFSFFHALNPTFEFVAGLAVLTPKEKKSVNDDRNVFMIGLFIATFLAGASAIIIALGAFQLLPKVPWSVILDLNEIGSMMIFMLFLLADYMGYCVCKNALKHEKVVCEADRQYISSSLKEIGLMILAVDLPGFSGILFICLLSHALYPEFIQYYYWHGFTAGAIALHVAFSQTALALISFGNEQSNAFSESRYRELNDDTKDIKKRGVS